MKKGIKTFIPKQDQRLPDGWGITVRYLDGSNNDEFVGTHRFITVEGDRWLEIMTINDELELINKEVIKSVKFDNRFSKAMEIRHELKLKADAAAAAAAQAKK